MATKDDEFLRKLRETFKVEAEEHLQAIAGGLLELEKTSAAEKRHEIVEQVFRAAHSLKGAARAVDFTVVESLCQSLEDVFAIWKKQNSTATSRGALDTMHRALDAISTALAEATGKGTTLDLTSPLHSLRQLEATPQLPAEGPGPAAASAAAVSVAAATALPTAADRPGTSVVNKEYATGETVRIAVAKLEARLLESEEMLTAKLSAAQRAIDLRELAGRFDVWRTAWTAVEPEARRLRRSGERSAPAGHAAGLTRLLDFFDWSLDYFKSVEHSTVMLGRVSEQDRYIVGKLVDDLLEDSKKLLLLPFSTISTSFPKLVRDLCRDQGKNADLTILGDDLEIDKRILEQMKDPLVHLLRNCVDHGIEPPAERAKRGKPSQASITLAITQVNGSKVQLLVSDDGAGIDVEKVKQSAVKQGLISAAEAARLGERAAQALIFQSNVSTSPIITQVSGRGLGLAIAREKAEKLGGEISVESRPGAGTTFRVIVEATRATLRGILVEAAGRQLVVPTAQVERVTRARPEDIKTVEGRQTLSFGGHAVALVPLAEVLQLPVDRKEAPPGGTPVVILASGEQRIAFSVDAVIDEQEVLVKPLRKPLARVRNVAGATVLSAGQVAPILNVPDLLKSARKASAAPRQEATRPVQAEDKTPKILVVEDSITSRLLLKGILESAGYNVRTAVDGIEAFTSLRAESFDLVVSDVEMPRLNGFDLTAKIRADSKLAELPVVLVTALATREDRERGIDVGANAYIVKGSFDQSNLLEAVKRLI